MLRAVFLSSALLIVAFSARAEQVTVAVAANFSAPMQKIAQAFEQDTGHKAVLSFGSTGSFYSQIRNGAPFQVFLSADDETPLRIEKEGLGVAGTRFTYAVGRVVLWSRQPGLVDDKGEILRTGKFERIAITNPKLAPYGAAAIEALNKLGLLSEIQPRFVQGENLAQTYQFIATENASLGFIALSQIFIDGKLTQGSAWVVPSSLHAPIRQDAVLLTKGSSSQAATALLAFLKGEKAKSIIRSHGYEL
jgi:molybdate transport system substrate-binding protein